LFIISEARIKVVEKEEAKDFKMEKSFYEEEGLEDIVFIYGNFCDGTNQMSTYNFKDGKLIPKEMGKELVGMWTRFDDILPKKPIIKAFSKN
jgi:hypothetical protein